ncbi:MAG: hypothetical protein V2I76_10600, partial [Roseobacter sp.]|nr:hypothetical protein [Roseobacter sp.]
FSTRPTQDAQVMPSMLSVVWLVSVMACYLDCVIESNIGLPVTGSSRGLSEISFSTGTASTYSLSNPLFPIEMYRFVNLSHERLVRYLQGRSLFDEYVRSRKAAAEFKDDARRDVGVLRGDAASAACLLCPRRHSFWPAGQFRRSNPDRPLPRRTWRDVLFHGEVLPWRSQDIEQRRVRRGKNPCPDINGRLTFY